MQTLYEIGYYNNKQDDFHYEQKYFQNEQESIQGAFEMKTLDDDILYIRAI